MGGSPPQTRMPLCFSATPLCAPTQDHNTENEHNSIQLGMHRRIHNTCRQICFICRPVASHPGGGGGLNLDRWNTGADTGFPEGGLDIVRVTSSALHKIEKHPHSWTFTSTPPLDIARVTSSTFQGGGG